MTRLRIMVIDDDRDTADSTATLLQLLGHEVTVAYAGGEAVEAAKECEPDIVLLDIGMPEMDGFEVARRLREETDAALVAVSGFGRDADVAKAKEAGIDHYLIKPVDLDQMQAVLSKQIANKAGESLQSHLYSALRQRQLRIDGREADPPGKHTLVLPEAACTGVGRPIRWGKDRQPDSGRNRP
jgi:DNA-binding response OmpR family regulator